MEQIKIITLSDAIEKQNKSIWHKIVPILLFLSFMFVNIYSAIMMNNALAYSMPGNGMSNIFSYVLVYGLMEYIVYRLFFWLYTLILNHSIYAMCIPYVVFKDQFQTCFLIKNILLGIVGLLLLNIPYTLTYISVLGLIVNLSIIPIIFKLNKNTFIPKLVAHNVFRAYALPYFLYFVLDVVSFVVGVA